MKKVALIYLILSGISFWTLKFIPDPLEKLNDLFLVFISLKCMFDLGKQKDMRFKGFITLYIIGILGNILSAFSNHGQSPVQTAYYMRGYFFILFYFYLHANKVNLKELENLIIIFSVIYCLIYLWVKNSFPSPVIKVHMFIDRGTLRVKFPGNGFQMLAYFLLWNRFLIERKVWQVGIMLFLFATMFMAGYRSLAAGAVLISGIMYVRLVNYSPMNYLILIPMLVLFLGLLQVGDNATILQEMISASEDQADQGEDYIRVVALDFFRHDYPKNFMYYIFGGGYPAGFGAYASYMLNLSLTYGIFWVDLGLIGYYWVIGGVALLGLVGWSLKALFMKLPADKIYLGMFFLFLIIVSFTTKEIFKESMLAVEAVALYIIDKTMSNNDELESQTEN